MAKKQLKGYAVVKKGKILIWLGKRIAVYTKKRGKEIDFMRSKNLNTKVIPVIITPVKKKRK